MKKLSLRANVHLHGSPFSDLEKSLASFVELYDKLGPVETKLAILTHEAEALREVMNKKKFYDKFYSGCNKITKWLEKELPKAFPEKVESIEEDDRVISDEFEEKEENFGGKHPHAHLPEHGHPEVEMKFTISFHPGAFASDDEAVEYFDTMDVWFKKHGMTEVEYLDSGKFQGKEHHYYIEIQVLVFYSDVSLW